MRVLLYKEDDVLKCINIDNDETASIFIDKLNEESPLVPLFRELTEDEIAEAFGDYANFAGDEHTTIVGTELSSAVVSRTEPTPPAKTLDECKAEVKALRKVKQYSPVTIGSNTFDTTPNAVVSLSAKGAFLLHNESAEPFKWKLADDSWATLTRDEFLEVGTTIGNYIQACYDNESDLVEQLTEAGDLSSVDLTVGWPTATY